MAVTEDRDSTLFANRKIANIPEWTDVTAEESPSQRR